MSKSAGEPPKATTGLTKDESKVTRHELREAVEVS